MYIHLPYLTDTAVPAFIFLLIITVPFKEPLHTIACAIYMIFSTANQMNWYP